MKKRYEISVSADSGSDITKELTDVEYEFLKSIFEELNNNGDDCYSPSCKIICIE